MKNTICDVFALIENAPIMINIPKIKNEIQAKIFKTNPIMDIFDVFDDNNLVMDIKDALPHWAEGSVKKILKMRVINIIKTPVPHTKYMGFLEIPPIINIIPVNTVVIPQITAVGIIFTFVEEGSYFWDGIK